MKLLKKFWKRITGDRWVVARCCWPYPEGYGTYNRRSKTIADTGLTREQAQQACEELNARE